MAVQKISIAQFLELAQHHPVLDVRSPGEYAHAHMTCAYSLPLFTDEERKVVGTAYKQQNRKTAIKIALDYFGLKMRKMVEEVESMISRRIGNSTPENENCVLIHCWRGGMRSEGVAWLLDLYGFKVYTLSGGYKAYRKWIRSQFEKPYNFLVLGGYTGSGKTLVIQELKRLGRSVVDLEGLASHKGSAFGALGEKPQPSQEMFENLLGEALFEAGSQQPGTADISSVGPGENVIFIEDESRRIGLINIPNELWNRMQSSTGVFLDIPFEERLGYLTAEYGKYEQGSIAQSIIRIQKRLGGQETKAAINHLLENNNHECFRILLEYYDKWYKKSLLKRENLSASLNKISCGSVDVKTVINKLINERATA